MQLRSARRQVVTVGDLGLTVSFDAGEQMRTEVSAKFRPAGITAELAIAAGSVPAELRPAVADLADLVESGRCPGDLLAERVGEIGPLAALGEMAYA